MKPSEIRALNVQEIRTRLEDARGELMNLRFQMSTGGLTDHTRLRQTRQTIARLLTILQERETETEEGES